MDGREPAEGLVGAAFAAAIAETVLLEDGRRRGKLAEDLADRHRRNDEVGSGRGGAGGPGRVRRVAELADHFFECHAAGAARVGERMLPAAAGVDVVGRQDGSELRVSREELLHRKSRIDRRHFRLRAESTGRGGTAV